MKKILILSAISMCALVATSCNKGEAVKKVDENLEELTLETVVSAVNSLCSKSIIGYDEVYYRYQYNYNTNEVLYDLKQTLEYKGYTNGFECNAVIENGSGIEDEFVADESSTIKGVESGYAVSNENYYAHVFDSSEGEGDGSEDFYEALEANKWLDESKHFDLLVASFESVMTTAASEEGVWPSTYGYAEPVDSFSVDVENNCYVFRRTSTASATDEQIQYGYAEEENYVEFLLDADFELISFEYHAKIANGRFESGGINGVTQFVYNNFQFGTKSEKSNIHKMSEERINSLADDQVNREKEVVSGIEDGTISEENVLAIFDNIAAYCVDTKSSHNEFDSKTMDSDWNEIDISVVSDVVAYKDYLTICEQEVTLADESDQYEETIQVRGGDEGVETSSKIGDDIECSFIQISTVGATTVSYFNPNGYYVNALYYYFQECDAFGTVESWGTTTRALVSATKEGSTINIVWTLDTVYGSEYLTDTHYKFDITIEDDFLSGIKVYNTSGEGEVLVQDSTNVKGEKEEFTGTLIDFEMPTYDYY